MHIDGLGVVRWKQRNLAFVTDWSIGRSRFARGRPPLHNDAPPDFQDVGCSASEKSQPRNGAGEIFITTAAEIARATVSATNRFDRETGNPRKYARKHAP